MRGSAGQPDHYTLSSQAAWYGPRTARFVTNTRFIWHALEMAAPVDPRPESAKPAPATGRVGIELEQELRHAVEEIERGDCIELSPEALDLWADAGVVPWPEESPG